MHRPKAEWASVLCTKAYWPRKSLQSTGTSPEVSSSLALLKMAKPVQLLSACRFCGFISGSQNVYTANDELDLVCLRKFPWYIHDKPDASPSPWAVFSPMTNHSARAQARLMPKAGKHLMHSDSILVSLLLRETQHMRKPIPDLGCS
jgi:hypothetical protein